MVIITERPYKFSFSENEIRYIFNVTNPATQGCAVEVELYYHEVILGGAFTLLTTVTLYPNSDGSVYCHLKDYLKSLLTPTMPNAATGGVQAATDQAKEFYIRYREISAADTQPDWSTDIENKRYVLLGGVEQRVFKRNNFFVNYHAANKCWLTWVPTNRMVFGTQFNFLTYLHTDNTVMGFDVVYTAVYTDGTSSTATSNISSNSHIVYHIGCSAAPFIISGKTLHYFEVKVTDPGSSTIRANAYRFYIDYNHYYQYNDFHFINSLGGIDSVRARGDFAWEVAGNKEDVQRVIYRDSLFSINPTAQYGHTNIIKSDVYKGDVGFMFSAKQQEVLVELLISKGIYEWVDGRWIRVLNLKKTQELRNTSDKKWSFAIEWSYGYDDAVFTPKYITLGAGTTA